MTWGPEEGVHQELPNQVGHLCGKCSTEPSIQRPCLRSEPGG